MIREVMSSRVVHQSLAAGQDHLWWAPKDSWMVILQSGVFWNFLLAERCCWHRYYLNQPFYKCLWEAVSVSCWHLWSTQWSQDPGSSTIWMPANAKDHINVTEYITKSIQPQIFLILKGKIAKQAYLTCTVSQKHSFAWAWSTVEYEGKFCIFSL